MIRRIAIGVAAGLAATMPQSAAIWGLKAAGVYRRRPPPEVVADEVTDAAFGIQRVPQYLRTPLNLAQHAGFGAAGGVLYSLATRMIPAGAVTGMLMGLLIWKASYDGWIPALAIMPPPQRDERGRQVALLIAHIAYGTTLGTLTKRLMDGHERP